MTLKTLDIAEATHPLAEYARQVESGPLVITIRGKPIAIVAALEDVDLETLAVSSNPQFQALIAHSRQQQQEQGGFSSEHMRQMLEG